MGNTRQEDNQKIFDDMTQIQTELEAVLNKILEQAGTRIQPTQQEEVRKRIEGTNQLLELFKHRYAS